MIVEKKDHGQFQWSLSKVFEDKVMESLTKLLFRGKVGFLVFVYLTPISLSQLIEYVHL